MIKILCNVWPKRRMTKSNIKHGPALEERLSTLGFMVVSPEYWFGLFAIVPFVLLLKCCLSECSAVSLHPKYGIWHGASFVRILFV
jgi:hypothetical protein